MTDLFDFPDIDDDSRLPPASQPAPAVSRPVVPVARAAKPSGAGFAGLSVAQLILCAAAVLLLVWCMWVTRLLTAEPPQRIVKADLSRIVGDYVKAQSRSATPPDQLQAQLRQFMSLLENEIDRRGAKGQVVLVGEAVLSKTVPDITPDVVRSLYAAGVKRPVPATPDQLSEMTGALPPGVGSTDTSDPSAAAFAFTPAGGIEAASRQATAALGGPNDQGGE